MTLRAEGPRAAIPAPGGVPAWFAVSAAIHGAVGIGLYGLAAGGPVAAPRVLEVAVLLEPAAGHGRASEAPALAGVAPGVAAAAAPGAHIRTLTAATAAVSSASQARQSQVSEAIAEPIAAASAAAPGPLASSVAADATRSKAHPARSRESAVAAADRGAALVSGARPILAEMTPARTADSADTSDAREAGAPLTATATSLLARVPPPLPPRRPDRLAQAERATASLPATASKAARSTSVGKAVQEKHGSAPASDGTVGTLASAPAISDGQGGGAGAGRAPPGLLAGANRPPRYPRSARRRGLEGLVVLRVQVSPRGDATSVTVKASSGHRILDRAAVKAVEAWRFQPAIGRGGAVAGAMDVPVRFRLDG